MNFGFVVANADDVGMFEFGEPLIAEAGESLPVGKRIAVSASIENRLTPGRYFVHSGSTATPGSRSTSHNAISFLVVGSEQTRGVVSLEPPGRDRDGGRVMSATPTPPRRPRPTRSKRSTVPPPWAAAGAVSSICSG